jgi:hypothetical protein
MNDQETAIKTAKEVGQRHPHIKQQIQELFELCQAEIEDGASPSNEYYLLIEDIKQLDINSNLWNQLLKAPLIFP